MGIEFFTVDYVCTCDCQWQNKLQCVMCSFLKLFYLMVHQIINNKYIRTSYSPENKTIQWPELHSLEASHREYSCKHPQSTEARIFFKAPFKAMHFGPWNCLSGLDELKFMSTFKFKTHLSFFTSSPDFDCPVDHFCSFRIVFFLYLGNYNLRKSMHIADVFI